MRKMGKRKPEDLLLRLTGYNSGTLLKYTFMLFLILKEPVPAQSGKQKVKPKLKKPLPRVRPISGHRQSTEYGIFYSY